MILFFIFFYVLVVSSARAKNINTCSRSLYVCFRFGGFYWTRMITCIHVVQEIHTFHILSRKVRSLECLDPTPGLALHPTTFEIGPRHLGPLFSEEMGPNVSGFKLWCTVGICDNVSCAQLELVHQIQVVFNRATLSMGTCTTLPPGFLWQTLSPSILYYRLWVHLNFTYACDCQQIQRTPTNRLFVFHVVLILPRNGKHGCRYIYIIWPCRGQWTLTGKQPRWFLDIFGMLIYSILFHVFCLWDVLPIAFYEYWFHLWLLESKTH